MSRSPDEEIGDELAGGCGCAVLIGVLALAIFIGAVAVIAHYARW